MSKERKKTCKSCKMNNENCECPQQKELNIACSYYKNKGNPGSRGPQKRKLDLGEFKPDKNIPEVQCKDRSCRFFSEHEPDHCKRHDFLLGPECHYDFMSVQDRKMPQEAEKAKQKDQGVKKPSGVYLNPKDKPISEKKIDEKLKSIVVNNPTSKRDQGLVFDTTLEQVLMAIRSYGLEITIKPAK